MLKELDENALAHSKVIVGFQNGEMIGPCNYFAVSRQDVIFVEMNGAPVMINLRYVKTVSFVQDKIT